MATQAGSIQSIQSGKFFAKDENGNVRELNQGDAIYENDTVYGDNSNASSAKVEILLAGDDVIVLNQGQKQLIDSSLIETAFGTEELYFTREAIEQKIDASNAQADVESDLRAAKFKNDANITEEETTEGEEEAEDEEQAGGQFAARDGALTDVESDLRKKLFLGNVNLRKDVNALGDDFKLERTQSFNESKNNFENQNNSNKQLGQTPSNPFENSNPRNPGTPTNPGNPTNPTNPNTPTRPESEGPGKNIDPTPTTPPLIPTKPLIPAKLSIDDVTMYEQDGKMYFTVTLDKPAQGDIVITYKTQNKSAEAGKDYKETTGTITIPSGSSSIKIPVDIYDDFIYEKSENFELIITDAKGSVKIEKGTGIGTILDNPVNNPSNNIIGKPTEDGGYTEDDTVYAIITGDTKVNEGDKSSYTVTLVDKNGVPLKPEDVKKDVTVTVKYTNIDTDNTDTQYKNNEEITIIIKAESSSTDFKVETKDDYIADNNEDFNLIITKVDAQKQFENVVIGDKNGKNKDVTTTIYDNTTTTPNGNSNTETNQEQVILKIVAVDKNGNPIGADGKVLKAGDNYTYSNKVPEGDNAYYKVIAFAPTAEFKVGSELPPYLQGGTVTISTENISNSAIGVDTQTAKDGTQDYLSKTQTGVIVGTTVIQVQTLDDWKADSGEQFNVKINEKTYAHPEKPLYENVKTDKNPVTTTIIDNSKDKDGNTTNPKDLTTPGIEPKDGENIGNTTTGKEAVILKIVAVNKAGEAINATGGLLTVGEDYVYINSVPEGNKAYYKVIAFAPDTIEFKLGKELPTELQGGTVSINTKDINEATKDEDYTSKIQTGVIVGTTIIEVETIDDLIADNGERFEVEITTDSYTHPTTPIYENVKAEGKVTTTILDNSKPVDENKPHNPNDPVLPPENSVEANPEIVILKIIAVNKDGNPIDASGNPIATGSKIEFGTANTVKEGDDAYYKVYAFAPGTEVFNYDSLLGVQIGSVDVEFNDNNPSTNNDATGVVSNPSNEYKIDGSEDYIKANQKVTIGEIFTTKTLDDYLNDNEETFVVSIKENTYLKTDKSGNDIEISGKKSNGYENITINDKKVTTTITDGTNDKSPNEDIDTVYVRILDDSAVVEGSPLTHRVQLVDKNGTPVVVKDGETITVNLVYENGKNLTSDDYTANTTITITAGNSEATITNQTIIDSFIEGEESYTVSISSVSQAQNTYENIAIDKDYNLVKGTIKDDVDLVDDSATVIEGNKTITHAEFTNLLANDEIGVDGEITSFTYLGEDDQTHAGTVGILTDTKYGTVIINADGTWTYTSDDREDHSLSDSLSETIVYTVTDSNTGQTGTANFVVTVTDDVPTAKADINSVTEEESVDAGKLIAIGNVFTNDTIGADTTTTPVTGVRVAGEDTTTEVTGSVATAVVGTYGTVVIAADGKYTYTANNSDVRIQHLTTGEKLTDTFVYTITDSDGDTSTTTLTITINGTDDLPTIVPVDGNNTEGNGTHIAGQATVYEEGLSTGSNPSSGKEKTIGTITISAKDGLTSVTIGGTEITEAELLAITTTNTISINTGEGTLVITGFTPSYSTHQDGKLLDGSGTISYTYTLNAKQQHEIVQGKNELTDNIPLIVTDRKTTANGTLVVTIVDDVPTAKADINSVKEDESVDGAGKLIATGNVVIGNTLAEKDTIGADTTDTPVTGIKAGTDTNTAVSGSVGSEVIGTYGKVTIAADGTYIYTAKNDDVRIQHLTTGETLEDKFVYTITDSDGDTSTTTLTIKIHGTDDLPTIVPVDGNTEGNGTHIAGQATVYEEGLSTGSNPSSGKEKTIGTITISAKDGLTSVTIGGTEITEAELLAITTTNTISINTGEGTLVITGFTPSYSTHQDGKLLDGSGTISYTYTLKEKQTHEKGAGKNELTDEIALIVTDRKTTANGTLVVTIVDDVPTAKDDDTVGLIEGGAKVTSTAETNLLKNDTLGADGATITSIKYQNEENVEATTLVPKGTEGVKVITYYGTLTVKADGSWEYTPDASVHNPNGTENVTDSFTYTLTDGDGDISTATKSFTIADGVNPTILPAGLTVDETTLGTDAKLKPFTVTDNILNVKKGSDEIADTKFAESNVSTLNNLGITSGGDPLFYTVSTDGHTITANKGTSDGAEVFKVVITNPASTNAKYNFTLSLPIDHTKNKDDLTKDRDFEWNLPFSVYTVDTDDNGVVDNNDDASGIFTVKILDSIPKSETKNIILHEDETGGKIIRLSQDAFEGVKDINGDIANKGSIKLDSTEVKVGGKIDIKDGTSVIGELINLGDGTVKFIPNLDYSNYHLSSSSFTYTITDNDGDEATGTVNLSTIPVTDKAIWDTNNDGVQTDLDKISVQTLEDTKVALGLIMPTIKDNTDENGELVGEAGKGDHGERLGYITLESIDTGAGIYKGDTLLFTGADNANTMKIVIVTAPDVLDTSVHYGDLSLDGAIQLTQDEFKALQILPPLNKHKDIDMTLNVTSYEVTDDGKRLDKVVDGVIEYNIPGSTSSLPVHVEVLAVTDPITLSFDYNEVDPMNILGTVSSSVEDSLSNDTFTYKAGVLEGIAAIDLKALLTNTSGTSISSKGDLDGSENRSYTVSGIPKGTIINVGGRTGKAETEDGSGNYKVTVKFPSNTAEDPSFTMELPSTYSGSVKATITLSVTDTDSDTDNTTYTGYVAPITLIKTVYFNIDVAPVAPLATIQFGQPVGYEDAGRGKGNGDATDTNSSKDITNPEKGIDLAIKVSTSDNDGSETIKVTIGDIPKGGAIYLYDSLLDKNVLVEFSDAGVPTIKVFDLDGTLSTASSEKITAVNEKVIIEGYNNSEAPKFIPPHNAKGTYEIKVEAITTDKAINAEGNTVTDTSLVKEQIIQVLVKDKADLPIGTELKTLMYATDANAVSIVDGKVVENGTGIYAHLAVEDKPMNFADFYDNPSLLKSYDESETLSISVKLPDRFNFKMTGEGTFKIVGDTYVFKAEDLSKVLIGTPTNFSGEASFEVNYITTDKNDSKTHDGYKQNFKIFVAPIAEAEIVKASSGVEDEYFKVDLGIVHKNGDDNETLEGIKILASDVDGQAFTLYSDIAGTKTQLSVKTAIGGVDYYVLTAEEAKHIYAKNTVVNKPDAETGYTFSVKYTIKDTVTSTTISHSKEFDTTYTLNIKPVTDAPNLSSVTITDENNDAVVSGSSITVKAGEETSFTAPVTTKSDDEDGSETVTKIVISGVPTGVDVYFMNADNTYTKLEGTSITTSGSEHNRIFTIDSAKLADKVLDTNGALQNIKFELETGANFETRDIKITTYTQDVGAEELNASTTIKLIKDYGTGPGPGEADFALGEKEAIIYEDNKDGDVVYNIGKSVTASGTGLGAYTITLSGFAVGTKVDGVEITGINQIVTVTGTGNAADVMTKLSNVLVTPPANVNTVGEAGKMTFTAKITTIAGGDKSVTINETILPITDEMKVEIDAKKIDEGGTSAITVTLSNPNDGAKTEIVTGSFIVKITETWNDKDQVEGTKEKGTLTSTPESGYTVTPHATNAGEYIVTGTFPIGEIKGLQYTAPSNRDGDVKFEVSLSNKEGHEHAPHDSGTKTATKDITIQVNPVVDAKISDIKITANGTEDLAIGTIGLKNPMKLEITGYIASPDKSETLGNIILDEVPNGFVVYYMDGIDLKMAMNIGKSGTGIFDLTPNISGDTSTYVNKWLIPTKDGVMPQIYINAPDNWSGNVPFKAIFTAEEQNLPGGLPNTVVVTGKITPVADGVTIDPTLTFGSAFSWVDLKLNANMKDIDGSEVMNLELTGLSASSQFRIEDGSVIKTYGQSDIVPNTEKQYAKLDGSKWTITGIKYDEINKIQFTSDKDVSSVGVNAWTQEIKADGTNATTTDSTKPESDVVNGSFKVDVKEISGNFTLDKDINLDFSKLDKSHMKNLTTIDLKSGNGKNEILDLKLADVLAMTDSNKQLIIKGDGDDKVSFKASNGWSKGGKETIDSKTFDIYSNSSDSSVKVKVETTITDITL